MGCMHSVPPAVEVGETPVADNTAAAVPTPSSVGTPSVMEETASKAGPASPPRLRKMPTMAELRAAHVGEDPDQLMRVVLAARAKEREPGMATKGGDADPVKYLQFQCRALMLATFLVGFHYTDEEEGHGDADANADAALAMFHGMLALGNHFLAVLRHLSEGVSGSTWTRSLETAQTRYDAAAANAPDSDEFDEYELDDLLRSAVTALGRLCEEVAAPIRSRWENPEDRRAAWQAAEMAALGGEVMKGLPLAKTMVGMFVRGRTLVHQEMPLVDGETFLQGFAPMLCHVAPLKFVQELEAHGDGLEWQEHGLWWKNFVYLMTTGQVEGTARRE